MRVIVDVMSGDKAPGEIIDGVIAASKECDSDFILVGKENEIQDALDNRAVSPERFRIVNASDVITMKDDPIAAVQKKKDSSMRVALRLLSDGEGDAMVSTGNTGALFTGATLYVKRIEGISRAALGLVIEGDRPFLLIDTGANATVFEEHMEMFALMGMAYMRRMYGISEPRVGLLNIGAEESKGTPIHVSTNRRLAECASIHYVGNVEPAAAFGGACDVLVTDGFTGNIFLKTIEGCAGMIPAYLQKELSTGFFGKIYMSFIKNKFNKVKYRYNTTEKGGAPILGISKCIIKAHGAADSLTFKNAVLEVIRYADSGVVSDIAIDAVGILQQ